MVRFMAFSCKRESIDKMSGAVSELGAASLGFMLACHCHLMSPLKNVFGFHIPLHYSPPSFQHYGYHSQHALGFKRTCTFGY